MGHPIVMGRKTFESIGRPLPGRRSVIISRNSDYNPHGAEVYSSLERAFQALDNERHIYVIGGREIYQLAIPTANRIHCTRVETTVDGDTLFPETDWSRWRVTNEEFVPASEVDEYASTYQVLERT